MNPTTESKALATPEPSVALMTDRDIEDLSRQESLPPNQVLQLPSDEQPTDNKLTYIYAK